MFGWLIKLFRRDDNKIPISVPSAERPRWPIFHPAPEPSIPTIPARTLMFVYKREKGVRGRFRYQGKMFDLADALRYERREASAGRSLLFTGSHQGTTASKQKLLDTQPDWLAHAFREHRSGN